MEAPAPLRSSVGATTQHVVAVGDQRGRRAAWMPGESTPSSLVTRIRMRVQPTGGAGERRVKIVGCRAAAT